MRVLCKECDEEHDLEDVEPRFGLPDEVFALTNEERARRVQGGMDWCVLSSADGDEARFFLRALVPFTVAGRERPFHWCVWVELGDAAFAEVREVWSSELQLESGPWRAALANAATSYPSTLGLPGYLRFVDVRQLPRFAPLADEPHLFAADFRAGLSEDRLTELQLAHLHRRPSLPTSSDADPEEQQLMVDCAEHGRAPACVVCTHLVRAREQLVGFVENSSEPGDLQAWCGACERLFEQEGDMTDAFREFNDMRLVCSVCYTIIKQRHSPLS
jgi:hypothetical protein